MGAIKVCLRSSSPDQAETDRGYTSGVVSGRLDNRLSSDLIILSRRGIWVGLRCSSTGRQWLKMETSAVLMGEGGTASCFAWVTRLQHCAVTEHYCQQQGKCIYSLGGCRQGRGRQTRSANTRSYHYNPRHHQQHDSCTFTIFSLQFAKCFCSDDILEKNGRYERGSAL